MIRRRGDTSPDWLVRLNDDNMSTSTVVTIVAALFAATLVAIVVLSRPSSTQSVQYQYERLPEQPAYVQGGY